MKIFSRIAVCMSLALFFIACSDEDKPTDASIIGKWKGDRMDIKLSYGIVPLHDESDEDFDAVIEFKEDGIVNYTDDGTTTTGTYSLDGTKLTTNVDFQIEEVDLSEVTFDVVELSETKLRLYVEREQEVQVPDLGLVDTDVEADLTFDRL